MIEFWHNVSIPSLCGSHYDCDMKSIGNSHSTTVVCALSEVTEEAMG